MQIKRFQSGTLWLNKGKRSRRWYLRYTDPAGKRRLKILGDLAALPNKSKAQTAAAEFLATVNGGRRAVGPATVAELVAKYKTDELPARISTRAAYASLLDRHIAPRWGSALLTEIKPVDVEVWLKGLERTRKDGKVEPLSTKTRSNIRQLFHVLFECAKRWELFTGDNPIGLVRQSAKRSRKLAKLSITQYQQLVAAMVEPHRTMVLIAGCLGLRIGEIIGLQWGDVDFDASLLHVQRDVYQGHVDDLKSTNSDRFLPLPDVVADSLTTWRENAAYQADEEYVFSQDGGRRRRKDGEPKPASTPMWADSLRENVLQPTAERLGIGKIGWHAFRHLFASVLQVVGAEGVVAKELMGHADEATTALYRYGLDERKRAATDGVAALLGAALKQ